MILFEIFKKIRFISAITNRRNESYKEYLLGISYIKTEPNNSKLFTDYNNALTLDLILVHFAIEWKTKEAQYEN